MNQMELDRQYMLRAIKLAEQGRYSTTPNPNVGCVIVNHGEVVGEGWHKKAGTPHAEVHALAMAGDKAAGAIVYVTLEPCSHTGRTGPCADALVAAKVARVVIAMKDPNPQVAGRGIRRLESHGIEICVGVLREQAEMLNLGFLKRMRTNRPFVTLKLATSLDGRIALANGKSQWITSDLARQDVQNHRGMSCAILSTAETVLADQASLTFRPNQLTEVDAQYYENANRGHARQPIRVILDQHHRLTGDEPLFQSEGEIILVSHKTRTPFTSPRVRYLTVENSSQGLNVAKVFDALATQFEINHVWVEAGAKLAGSLLTNGLVDQLIQYQAPKLLGDSAKAMVSLPELTELSQSYRFDVQKVETVGQDIKITMLTADATSSNLE